MSEDKPSRKKRYWIGSFSLLFLLIGIGWLLYWIFVGRFSVYTNDAYVHGNEVKVTPQVAGAVEAIFADETDLVEEGSLIISLDSSNYALEMEQLQMALADTVREVASLFQKVASEKAEVVLREAELRQAKLDLSHREGLVETGAVSLEEFQTYETAVIVAEAQLEFAKEQLKADEALIEGTTVETHPRVLQASWALKEAYLNFIRCQIWAPATGFIAKRTAQVGDQVAAGETLLFIVPLDQIWLEANFKETRLKNLRIGQPVTYHADMYGRDVEYHGKVVGFQPGTGNAFALLPPENAAGNWIKIIQRVPVRITIDSEEIKNHPLLLGLSMDVSVDTHDRDGSRLTDTPTSRPLYTTTIYQRQLEQMQHLDRPIQNMIKRSTWVGP
ncbi:MAG: Multidrug export protein EmrA [Chlamydiae bacterium]|nr:Multidrug export protein EmrA [Chlamydiota bacterium]